MARPFDFSLTTLRDARFRQWGLCACCGDSLDWQFEAGHHVIPNQSGRPGDPADLFLRSVNNCVILCSPCHDAVHAHGGFRHGPVAGPESYPYSHGKGARLAHDAWRATIDREWGRLAKR